MHVLQVYLVTIFQCHYQNLIKAKQFVTLNVRAKLILASSIIFLKQVNGKGRVTYMYILSDPESSFV